MAINACQLCGNARGSKDCEESCGERESRVAPKTLVQSHYPEEIIPFIAASKAEVEKRLGYQVFLDKTSRPIRNEIMAKAITMWMAAKTN